MKSKRTIQDIADSLGLSRVAVSSVINGKCEERGISLQTATKVKEYIERNGFVPSASARRLRSGRALTIGILHSGQLYSHLIEAFNRFTDYFVEMGYDLEILIMPSAKIVDGVSELLARGITKLVWIQTGSAKMEFAAEERLFNMLKHIDTVIYNYSSDGVAFAERIINHGISSVGIDRLGGFKELAGYLSKTGHTSVALCWSKLYYPAYHRPFEQNGMRVNWIYPEANISTKEIAQWICDDFILKRQDGEIIDVICTMDELLAGYLIRLLRERGVCVPEDVSLTSFDGMEFGNVLRVPITTLAVPVKKMVEKSIELLNGKSNKGIIWYKPELVLRSSHTVRN